MCLLSLRKHTVGDEGRAALGREAAAAVCVCCLRVVEPSVGDKGCAALGKRRMQLYVSAASEWSSRVSSMPT